MTGAGQQGRGGDEPERPPSWMGAPGYVPSPELPPHAPMPGAPPYPAGLEHPPPQIRQRPPGRRPLVALGAAAVWAGVNFVLALLVSGPPPTAALLGQFVGFLLLPTVLTALVVQLVAARRSWAFWQLALLALPVFAVLRALTVAL